ncbi:MAG: MAPEG family protein [Pseudomonadota bacterium]
MITGLYAALLMFLQTALAVYTIKARRKNKVAIGNGGNEEVAGRSRAHANLTENVPIFLILLLLIEAQDFWTIGIHLLGIVFLLGRLAHAKALITANLKYRVFGMSLTFTTQIIVALIALWLFVEFNFFL